LLIEDNQGDVRLIWEILSEVRNSPFYLEVADTLLAGLNAIQKAKPDVVLLDLSLPDSNGIYTLNRVRDKAKNVPVVVMTGLDDEVTAIKALKEGAQDYLVKGRTDSDLLKRAIIYSIERNRMMLEVEDNERKMDSVINKMLAHDRLRGAIFAAIISEIEKGASLDQLRNSSASLGKIYAKDSGPEAVSVCDPAEIIKKITGVLKVKGSSFTLTCDSERLKAAFELIASSSENGIEVDISQSGNHAEFSITGVTLPALKAADAYRNNRGANGADLAVYAACGLLEAQGATMRGSEGAITFGMPIN